MTDEFVVDEIQFDNADARDRYLAIKALDERYILYLARSKGHQLKRRDDPVYRSVASSATNPDWVTGMAAGVALRHGWIDESEWITLTTR